MHTEDEIAKGFVSFLTNFMTAFPEYQRSELYIAGESFAGTYIPYIANAILDKNEKGGGNFKLRGIAIGNGWMDPERQYQGYVPFAEKYGLIDGENKVRAKAREVDCAASYKNNGPRIKYGVCEVILDEIINYSRREWVESGLHGFARFNLKLRG